MKKYVGAIHESILESSEVMVGEFIRYSLLPLGFIWRFPFENMWYTLGDFTVLFVMSHVKNNFSVSDEIQGLHKLYVIQA